MQLFVRTLTGKNIALQVESSESVQALKSKIQSQEGVCVEDQRLVFGAKQLEDNCLLEEYEGLTHESTVALAVSVDGGKKKKKKKKMIKGKQMKKGHKHVNVRLRVLKYFKVEGDGESEDYKVTRTKQECPHPDCGAGVFMASHNDRSTCGKCSLTYVKDSTTGKKK